MPWLTGYFSAQGSTTYNYHYDGTNLIRITNNSGATVWSFTWADGKPVSMTNASGTTYYYVTNFRGDVIRIMDGNGATVASYSYDPWGKVLSASENSAVVGQPIRYASYVYESETQLYYLQARYYDPETARFISRDPDGGDQNNPISQNLYAYANDDPVNNVDPDGEWALPVALAGAWAFGGADFWNPVGWVVLGAAAIATTVWLGYTVYDRVIQASKAKPEQNIDPYARPGQKTKGRERKEKKKKDPSRFKPNPNKRIKPPEHHTPGRDHQKYPQ